ncbi:MAG: HDIG domain-containing metalloprotein [Candidatus Aminicenantia bacterium]
MEREKALEILKAHLSNKNLIKHSLALEACMRGLARHFHEDEERWGLAGLIHDLDYEKTQNEPEKHTLIACEILREHGVDEEILKTIRCHAGIDNPSTKMEWAIYSADPLTGLIVASVLMHPTKKIKNVDTDFVLRRFKEKSFAKGADRNIILECKNLGLSLEEFVDICLKSMQEIDQELGL